MAVGIEAEAVTETRFAAEMLLGNACDQSEQLIVDRTLLLKNLR